MAPTDSHTKWTDAYRSMMEDGSERQWPSETLIRIIKGPYLREYGLEFAGKKILDVGFGAGESFLFLNTLDAQLYGTEVESDICQLMGERLERYGISAQLDVGTNRKLPYPDDFFDYLISWNVIHYESNEEHMLDAIREYARVLAPGGRIFISTTGPQHKILDGAEEIGKHQYRIGRTDDHRRGEVFFYFDEASEIRRMFGTAFDDILIGRTVDTIFNETLDWFIVTAVKR